VERKLVGRILQKFEDAGLTIEKLTLCKPTREQAEAHYNMGDDNVWLRNVGKKAISIHRNSKKLLQSFGSANAEQIGKLIYEWSVRQLVGKAVVVMVLSGPAAVSKIKLIVGSTIPSESDLSTIRGIYSSDSVESSNISHRAIHNVVHRSTSISEAKREINVWFGT